MHARSGDSGRIKWHDWIFLSRVTLEIVHKSMADAMLAEASLAIEAADASAPERNVHTEPRVVSIRSAACAATSEGLDRAILRALESDPSLRAASPRRLRVQFKMSRPPRGLARSPSPPPIPPAADADSSTWRSHLLEEPLLQRTPASDSTRVVQRVLWALDRAGWSVDAHTATRAFTVTKTGSLTARQPRDLSACDLKGGATPSVLCARIRVGVRCYGADAALRGVLRGVTALVSLHARAPAAASASVRASVRAQLKRAVAGASA